MTRASGRGSWRCSGGERWLVEAAAVSSHLARPPPAKLITPRMSPGVRSIRQTIAAADWPAIFYARVGPRLGTKRASAASTSSIPCASPAPRPQIARSSYPHAHHRAPRPRRISQHRESRSTRTEPDGSGVVVECNTFPPPVEPWLKQHARGRRRQADGRSPRRDALAPRTDSVIAIRTVVPAIPHARRHHHHLASVARVSITDGGVLGTYRAASRRRCGSATDAPSLNRRQVAHDPTGHAPVPSTVPRRSPAYTPARDRCHRRSRRQNVRELSIPGAVRPGTGEPGDTRGNAGGRHRF
jgi:hypothetical protein